MSDRISVSDVELNYLVQQLLDKIDSKLDSSGGSAAAADKLTNEITISLSGDGYGDAKFDGTKDVNINITINKITGPLVLGEDNFGNELPESGLVPGRIFFKRVINDTL